MTKLGVFKTYQNIKFGGFFVVVVRKGKRKHGREVKISRVRELHNEGNV
jgi:hypothetical protein